MSPALLDFARSVKGQPFVWGETNCLMLAFRAIDVQAGTTLARHAALMRSARAAARWTRRNGLSGLVAGMVAEGCLALGDPAFAQAGDVLLGTTDDGQIAAHVCLGSVVLSSRPETGVGLFGFGEVLPKLSMCLAPPGSRPCLP